uniref:SH2 domain-containing protein n=1 Tax=Cyprinus carpio TaxID=7962 RepID=A0A8C2FE17_CYPCA
MHTAPKSGIFPVFLYILHLINIPSLIGFFVAEGSYLIRESQRQPGTYTLALRYMNLRL